MTEGSLSLRDLAVAIDACVTVAEALDDSDPQKMAYLNVGKRIADLVQGVVDANTPLKPKKPKLEIVKK
jgi:hypothetical protein